MHGEFTRRTRLEAIQQRLAQAKQRLETQQLRDLFATNPTRTEMFSHQAAGIFADFSKHFIDEDALHDLLALAEETGVPQAITRMFAGEEINTTEQRAVLHPALRGSGAREFRVSGEDVLPEVHAVLARMAEFVTDVHNGTHTGVGGEPITDVVTIGIGGSHLGPQLAVEALAAQHVANLRFHFVSNIDGHELQSVLAQVPATQTLFIVASKTFTTQETMTNAQAARAWLVRQAGEEAVAQQFVALSTATELVAQFGIAANRTFPFWDWVGGRYSVWSAIGLPVMLAIGPDGFTEFLRGAEEMDEHFVTAPLRENLPVLLAALSVWYLTFWEVHSEAIIPYDARLQRLPAYLQQLVMESNGKSVTLASTPVTTPTSGVVWGAAGTDAQHSFFQLLHQGTRLIPVEFIAALRGSHEFPDQHTMLLANLVAQAEALLMGRSEAETAELLAGNPRAAELTPAMSFPGNKPSTVLLMNELTPATLGALIALYEHRTFVAGVMWGINSFDQMGVELGKQLAGTIASELAEDSIGVHDASTTALLCKLQQQKI